MRVLAILTQPFIPLLRRVLLACGLCLAALALTPSSPVLAHNALDSSAPVDGASVTAPLSEWVLTFTNDVPLNSASAEVIAADGIRTALPSPTHGATQKIVRFALPQTLSGAVSARWRLVGTDGHVVSGRVQFTIETTATSVPSGDTTIPSTNVSTSIPSTSDSTSPATPTTVPATSFNDDTPINLAPEPIRWSLRLMNYAALILFGGLLFAEMNLAQGVMSLARSLLVAKYSALALTVIPALQALIFVSDVNGTSIFGGIFQVGDAFSSTPGSMTVLRAASGGAFMYLLAQRSLHAFNARFTQLASINAAVYLTALAYAGHSRSSSVPWLGIPVDVVHTAASAVWLGGLVIFIFLVLPHVDAMRALQAFVRYGHTAQYAVGAIIVTGVIQTLRLHGGITTLFTTSHGRLLILKILFVSAMLKVGDINRRRLLRNLPTTELVAEKRRNLLIRASTTEAIVGGIVIAITAALVTSTFQ